MSKNDVTKNPDVSYEPRDVNVKAMGIAGGVIILVVIVAMILIAVLLRGLENQRAATGAAPLAGQAAAPPGPRLQPNPIDRTTAAQDLATLRASEDAILHSYGWVDQQAGVVRIPIDRAMELVVERYGAP